MSNCFLLLFVCLMTMHSSISFKNLFTGFSERKPRDLVEKNESYDSIFGEDIFNYYYPPNHTFISYDVGIYMLKLINDKDLNIEKLNISKLNNRVQSQPCEYADFRNINNNGNRLDFSVPDIVYPVLSIYSGPTLLRLFEYPENLVLYMIELWSKVDGLFKQFSKPNVRLHISKIVIIKDKSTLAYLMNSKNYCNMVSKHREIFNKPSINVLMSAPDEGHLRGRGHYFSSCANGFPHIYVNISLNYWSNLQNTVVALADQFDIHHEYSTITDPRIDHENNENKLNFFSFSDLAKMDIARYFWFHKCFNKMPVVQKPHKFTLPGQYNNLDSQCEEFNLPIGDLDGRTGDAVCENVCNITANSKSPIKPALDGTMCDKPEESKICLRRKCVKIPVKYQKLFEHQN